MLLPLALLPLGAIVLTAYALRPAGPAFAPLRLALVQAGVLVGALTVGSVELLGAGNLLTLPIMALTWAVGFLIALGAAALRWRRGGRAWPAPVPRVRALWAGAGRWERVLVLALAGLMLAELLVAILSPPNNFDSMTYHLPKIEHWAVNHNVGFFATRIHRQNSFSPGAEYLLLQLRLLTGGPRLYNLVQWSAGLGCVLATSRITGRLGGSRRAQLLTAFVVGTTPMVAMEASSTQTDLVCAAWVAALGMLVVDELGRRTAFPAMLLLGGATGLVAVTKPTGLLAAGPLLLLWGVAQLRLAQSAELHTVVRRVARTLLASAAIILVAALITGPYLHRTNEEWGNPLGPDYSRNSLSMQRHDPAAILVNGARILHTAFETPLAPVNSAAAHAVTGLADALHVNPQDPKITFVGTTFPSISWRPDEDSVSYPVQAALVLLGALVIAVRPRRVVDAGYATAARGYALAFWLGALLYPVIIKWQPWGNRLFLYALVLGAPLAGLWVDSLLRKGFPPPAPDSAAADDQAEPVPTGHGARRRIVAWVAVGALAVGGGAGWLAVGYGWPRRLVGGNSVFTAHGAKAMFNRREEWRDDYVYVAEQVRASGAKTVGLAQDSNTWEYPFWYLMPGVDIEALQSLMPNHPRADGAKMDAIICTVPEADCRATYVPAGWTLYWHGTAGYALPPGK